jgi:hypothetical protein
VLLLLPPAPHGVLDPTHLVVVVVVVVLLLVLLHQQLPTTAPQRAVHPMLTSSLSATSHVHTAKLICCR